MVSLKILQDDKKIKPPKGVSYDKVRANILPSSTQQQHLNALRVLLQTGKKDWGPYNVAYVIDKLSKGGIDPKGIAKMMGKTKGFVDRESVSFGLYKEYVDYLKLKQKTEDPRKYTYFQRAGDAVKKRFFSNKSGKREFFELITPQGNEKARIKSVALKGGLYHFNTIAQDEQILNRFLNNPDITVEEVWELYQGKYITAKFPWTKKIADISKNIKKIDEGEYVRFRKNKTMMAEIKTIMDFCKKILKN